MGYHLANWQQGMAFQSAMYLGWLGGIHGKGCKRERASFVGPVPVTYFGGKSKIAPLVWEALGDVKHYIEPFFGSGAVLLNRPGWKRGMMETICDSDGFVANVWRGIQFSPDEVARWCDWPMNHADLTARKRRLVASEKHLLENLIKDDKWHDAELAGYWIWAASCWIGNGLTFFGAIPDIAVGGKGVHKLGQRSESNHKSKDVQEPYNTNIYKWMRELSERLRYVRVVCGDWTRVCGGNWQDTKGLCGIFFDPPYGVSDRDTVYYHDSRNVAQEVMIWAAERGKLPTYRIVIAGYEEYKGLIDIGWRTQKWMAHGGYANSGNKRGKENRKRETLYFSPHCIDAQQGEFKFAKEMA